MARKQKTRPMTAKLRSGFHRPTTVERPQNIYYRPEQKQRQRREAKG